MTNARRRCASPIRACRLSCTSCCCSFSSREHLPTRMYASILLIAPLLGKKPSQLTPGRITYDLRRLRLHGLTERIPKTHRYRITAKGLRTAIFYTGLYNRSLRTGMAVISPAAINPDLPMAKSIRAAETALDKWHQHEKIAA